MGRDDNYPDDIRQYDNVPGSPFYNDPNEWMEIKADEMAQEWTNELHETGRVNEFDWELIDFACEIMEVPVIADEVDFVDQQVYQYLYDYALQQIQWFPEKYIPEPDYEALQWD